MSKNTEIKFVRQSILKLVLDLIPGTNLTRLMPLTSKWH